jgi:two-component SAPR family response regulator
LAYAIRNAFPAVPVILISGYTGDEFVMRDFELIPKPFTPETILAAVRKATGFGESKTNLAIE